MAKKDARPTQPLKRLIASIALLCLVSIVLLVARIIASDSMRYVFLLWNLVLAAIPLVIAVGLTQRIQRYGWLAWEQLALTAVFLVFLPNSFYLVTDFIHLRQNSEASLIYDVVLLASFMWSGLALGYSAIYLVHRQLVRRLPERTTMLLVAGVLLAVSFAIYLGRFSRWNTWDVLLQPAGLLFDVSDKFINPAVHTDTYITTFIIFVLISSVYWVIYEALRLARHL